MTSGRRPRRHVTPDEAKLWRTVTKQFVPLDPARVESEGIEQPGLAGSKPGHSKPTPPAQPVVAAKRPAPKIGAPLSDFEPRRAKRLAAGRLPIDGKLDLHGLRQDEARRELLSFLHRAQDAGLKHVKVITGKGAAGTEDAEPRPFDLFDDNRRGVLRDQVPRWLSDGSFRPLVVSFTVAGRGHGGGGALYVQIRKKAAR